MTSAYGSGRTSTKRYAVADVCSKPAPATEKPHKRGRSSFAGTRPRTADFGPDDWLGGFLDLERRVPAPLARPDADDELELHPVLIRRFGGRLAMPASDVNARALLPGVGPDLPKESDEVVRDSGAGDSDAEGHPVSGVIHSRPPPR